MHPLDHLATTLAHQDVAQAQREALIDLVVWAMYVDGAIKHEENEQLDEVVEQLSASTMISMESYLYTAIARVRDLWNVSERQARFLESIRERLGDDDMRETAYALCEAVVRADGELADAEQAFLRQVRRQFAL